MALLCLSIIYKATTSCWLAELSLDWKSLLYPMIFNCIDVGLTILSGLQRTSALTWLSVMYMQARGKTIVGGHIRIGVACKLNVNSTMALWELLQDSPTVNKFRYMYICVV